MPRKPNYSFARSQREQAKALKKQAKEDAKLALARSNADTGAAGATDDASVEPSEQTR